MRCAGMIAGLLRWMPAPIAAGVLITALIVLTAPAGAQIGPRDPTDSEIDDALKTYIEVARPAMQNEGGRGGIAAGAIAYSRAVKIHYPANPSRGQVLAVVCTEAPRSDRDFQRCVSTTLQFTWTHHKLDDGYDDGYFVFPFTNFLDSYWGYGERTAIPFDRIVAERLAHYGMAEGWPGSPSTPGPPGIITRLGYEQPWSEDRAVPLRLHVSVSDPTKQTIVGICEIEQRSPNGDPADRSTYLFKRAPCQTYEHVAEADFDYTSLDAIRLGPLSSPMNINVRLRVDMSDGQQISAIQAETSVKLEAAAMVYVVEQGGKPEQSMTVTLSQAGNVPLALPQVTYVSGWWGDILTLPIESVVALRCLDGSAGLIYGHGLADMYEQVGLGTSVEDMGFESNASILEALDVATTRRQDVFLKLIAGKLAGPVGPLIDVVKGSDGANPKALRLKVR